MDFLQEFSGSSPKRRRAEEKDEGIGSPDTMEEEKMEELRREILELRQQLDKERSARMQVEDQVRASPRPRSQTSAVLKRTNALCLGVNEEQSQSRGGCVNRCAIMSDKLTSWIDLNRR